jgi:hypothetical protein
MSTTHLETKRLRSKDGTIAFYALGKLHNVEGPALIPGGDEKKAEYYLFGIKHTYDQWVDKIKKSMNGVPWYKSASARGART